MEHPNHLSVDWVLAIHTAVLEAHGGRKGVRSIELLESAVAGPQATFGGVTLFEDVVEIAAAYLFYLCRNHPFVDGNKRVALTAGLVFLRLNDIELLPDGPAWEDLVFNISSSAIDRTETTRRLRKLVMRKKKS